MEGLGLVGFRERPLTKTIIFDGAMGTMLLSGCQVAGIPALPCEALNLSQPRLVQSIHEAYIRAGADVITTNTFCANRVHLSQFGLAEKLEEIVGSAVAIARRALATAGNRDIYLAGSIGPIVSATTTSRESMISEYRDSALALLRSGIDCLLLESFPTLEFAMQALAGVNQARQSAYGDTPVVLSVAPVAVQSVPSADTLQVSTQQILDMDVLMLGVNCGDGPLSCIGALSKLADVCDVSLLLMPSAGLPQQTEIGLAYPCSPDESVSQMVDAAQRFRLGAVGGCCGTTPAYISQLSAQMALRRESPCA